MGSTPDLRRTYAFGFVRFTLGPRKDAYRISGFRTPKRLCRLRAPFSCLEGLLDLFWEFRRPNCSAMCKAKLRKHTFIRFGGVEMSQFGKRQLQKPSSPSAAAFSARSSSFRASSTSLLDAHLPPLCLNQFLFFSGIWDEFNEFVLALCMNSRDAWLSRPSA